MSIVKDFLEILSDLMQYIEVDIWNEPLQPMIKIAYKVDKLQQKINLKEAKERQW